MMLSKARVRFVLLSGEAWKAREEAWSKAWNAKWDHATARVRNLRRASMFCMAVGALSLWVFGIADYFKLEGLARFEWQAFFAFNAGSVGCSIVWGLVNRQRDRLLKEMQKRTAENADECRWLSHWIGKCGREEK